MNAEISSRKVPDRTSVVGLFLTRGVGGGEKSLLKTLHSASAKPESPNRFSPTRLDQKEIVLTRN